MHTFLENVRQFTEACVVAKTILLFKGGAMNDL